MIDPACVPAAPRFSRDAIARVASELDLWDHWPVLDANGEPAVLAGGMLVVALAAPVLPDPEARHAVARLRLFHRNAAGWRDLGWLLPDGFSPGSREWAGSAVIAADRRRLTLYFTAAGQRGEARLSFDQRLFVTDAAVDPVTLVLSGWTIPRELVRPDGVNYQTNMQGGGAIGTIKAFRDPYFFRCPDDGRDYIVFAGSRAGATSDWNGVIGAARVGDGGGWTLLPPLVDATGIANELERPHAIVHDARTYLFWSTHAATFAPGIAAPTGLYGVVAERFGGPWRPLNGDGLVLANPPQAPAQAYSWQVHSDLSVWSFANLVDLPGVPLDAATARRHFGGTFAPPLEVQLSGDSARVVS